MGIEFNLKRTIAVQLQIQDELELHERLFSYHLASFDRLISAGDFARQDEQLRLAADHASIITALKGMLK